MFGAVHKANEANKYKTLLQCFNGNFKIIARPKMDLSSVMFAQSLISNECFTTHAVNDKGLRLCNKSKAQLHACCTVH